MKINTLNLNFGKKLVATCCIKNQNKEKCPASIYEYNPRNSEDAEEIKNSPYTSSIKRDFYRQYINCKIPANKYYILLDDKTKEVATVAKLSQHITEEGKYKGYYISIDELEENKNYIDSITPMIGFIANKANSTYSDNILTAFRTYEMPALKELKFKSTKEDIWALRSKGFNESILRAEKRNNLEIIQ